MDFSDPNALHHVLATVWFLIIGMFLVFYVVLDGFDLGVGVLSLFVSERRRKVMMSSLGSIWDANETWLVVIGGTLFGAFPLVYGTVLHGLYIPIMLMLLGFMLRGVSFEFHELSERKSFWGAMFGVGSLLAAIAQGFTLGGLLNGVKIVNGNFAGGVMDWASPFSAVVVLGVVAGYSMLGAAYLIIKTSGSLQEGFYRQGRWMAWLMLSVAAVVTVATPLLYPAILDRWFVRPAIFYFAVLPILAMGSFYMLLRALKQRRELQPFVWTVLIFLFSFAGLAATWYPYIVPGALTIDEASSASSTLVFMLIGIGMLIPVMIAYNVYQYVVFRGKIDPDAEYSH